MNKSPRTWTLKRIEDETHVEIAVVSGPCPGEHEYVEVIEKAPMVDLLDALTDPEPCWYDRNGYCQEHGWFGESRCPQAVAKDLLAAHGRLGDDDA